MASEKLAYVVSLIKSGNKQAALPILKELIQNEPNNEQAWLWLYSCVDPIEQKKYCLQQALKINPNNQDAHKALNRLTVNIQASSAQPARSQIQQLPPTLSQEDRPSSNPASTAVQRRKQPNGNNRSLLFIGGIVIVFIFCIGGMVLGGNWAYKKFATNSDGISGAPLIPNNPDYSQVGVFLLDDNGDLVNMEQSRGEPSLSGTPQTYNSYPSFVLNNPEIDPTNLIFTQYLDGRLQEEISYSLYEEGGAYHANTDTSLGDGIYCFAQYGPMVAPGQAHIWCVQVGRPDMSTINEPDATPTVAPTPTATPLPFPNVRITPFFAERIHGVYLYNQIRTDLGKDTLRLFLVFENNSEDYLFPEFEGAKVVTAENYEYSCSQGAEDAYIPPHVRTVSIGITCEIPELTTGHKIVLAYHVEKIELDPTQANIMFASSSLVTTYKWGQQTVEIPFAPASIPFLFPLTEGISFETYSRQDTSVHFLGETLILGDAEVTFDVGSSEDHIKVSAINKNIGYDTFVSFRGQLYIPGDEQIYSCITGNIHLIPGGSAEGVDNIWDDTYENIDIQCDKGFPLVSTLDDSTYKGTYFPEKTGLPPGSCFLWDVVEVSNTQNTFINDKFTLMCTR